MKTRNILGFILIGFTFLTQSCENFNTRIVGEGGITTQTLSVPDFTGIKATGVDNIHISYGPTQAVTVTGHRNIISRIERVVVNGNWYAELEDGNYGYYELTYYITVPYIDYVKNVGTGDIYIESDFNQDHLEVVLEGTGSFFGFSMSAGSCWLDMEGTGDCEITATDLLDIRIEGSGDVYYKGNPSLNSDITGSGKIISSNY